MYVYICIYVYMYIYICIYRPRRSDTWQSWASDGAEESQDKESEPSWPDQETPKKRGFVFNGNPNDVFRLAF